MLFLRLCLNPYFRFGQILFEKVLSIAKNFWRYSSLLNIYWVEQKLTWNFRIMAFLAIRIQARSSCLNSIIWPSNISFPVFDKN